MAPPKKKSRGAPEASGSESEDESMQEQILNVDFEAFPLMPEDKDGIQRLLKQLFLQAKIDYELMTDELIAQNPLGCVYKASEEEWMEDETIDDAVYGCVSVLPLHHPCCASVLEYIKKRLDKITDGTQKAAFHAKYLRKPQESDRKVAFLINERFINLPPQISAPSFQSLKSDLSEQSYTHFVLISKLHRTNLPSKKQKKKQTQTGAAGEGEVVYVNGEEEWLTQFQELNFEFSVASEIAVDNSGSREVKGKSTNQHTAMDEGDTSTPSLHPFRRVVCLDAAQLNAYIAKVNKELG